MKKLFKSNKQKIEDQLALERQRAELDQLRQAFDAEERLRRMNEEHERKEREWENERRELERRTFQQEQQERQRIEEERRIEGERQQAREQEELQRRADQNKKQLQLSQTTPEALRGLRDLIRLRYQLDVEIWSLKGARGPDRPIVLEKMAKSDAVLQEIYAMIYGWDGADWSPDEWKLAQRIKERLELDNKRKWENNPPWNERL